MYIAKEMYVLNQPKLVRFDERMTTMQVKDLCRKWIIMCIELKTQGANSRTLMRKMDCTRVV
jgi:hypothetical protein